MKSVNNTKQTMKMCWEYGGKKPRILEIGTEFE